MQFNLNPLKSSIALGLLPGVIGFLYGRLLATVPTVGAMLGLALFGVWVIWLLKSGLRRARISAPKPLTYSVLTMIATCIIVMNFLAGTMGGMTGQVLPSLKMNFFLGGSSLALIALAEFLYRPESSKKCTCNIEA